MKIKINHRIPWHVRALRAGAGSFRINLKIIAGEKVASKIQIEFKGGQQLSARMGKLQLPPRFELEGQQAVVYKLIDWHGYTGLKAESHHRPAPGINF